MKHVKRITVPARAEDAWWWTIGGIIAGLVLDNAFIDQGFIPGKKVNPQ